MVPREDLDSTLKRPAEIETETGVFWRENGHLRHGMRLWGWQADLD